MGATESGVWCLYEHQESSEYMSIDACHMGIERRPVVDNEAVKGGPRQTLYEAVHVCFKDPSQAFRQAIFHAFPGLTEVATGDLFMPHPTRPATWKHAGRNGDLILFSHGIKYRPGGTEAKIQGGHPWIQSAMIWGDGHQQVVLLLELTDQALALAEGDQQEMADFKTGLSRLIDKINQTAPTIAQIARTYITITSSEKPLLQTAKESIQRKEAVNIYQAEIDELYLKFGDQSANITSRVGH